MLILGLMFGSIADWIYREHGFRKIDDQKAGGVSKAAILGALALMIVSNSITNVINDIVIKTIIK